MKRIALLSARILQINLFQVQAESRLMVDTNKNSEHETGHQ